MSENEASGGMRQRVVEGASGSDTFQTASSSERRTRKSPKDEQDAFFHDRRYDPKRPFSQDSLADYERDFAAGLNPYLKAALSPKYDLTPALIDTLYRRLVETRKNYIITIRGPMGYGKSAAAMGLYKIMRDLQGLPYDIKHVLFTEEDLQAAVKAKSIKPRDTIIVDEDFKYGYGIGLTSLNNFVEFLNQSIRYEQVSIIYVGPDDVQSIAHRRFQVVDYNTKTRESRMLVHSSHDWAGVEFIGNVRIEGFAIPGYEERKAQFTQKVLLDDVRSHNKALVLIADKLIAENDILSYAQKAQKGIVRELFGQLSEKQIEGVLEILMGKKARMAKEGRLPPEHPPEKDDPDAPADMSEPPVKPNSKPKGRKVDAL